MIKKVHEIKITPLLAARVVKEYLLPLYKHDDGAAKLLKKKGLTKWKNHSPESLFADHSHSIRRSQSIESEGQNMQIGSFYHPK